MGGRRESGIVAGSLFFFMRFAMTRDDQETVTLNDPTAWQETAMPATASVDPVPPDPRVRVSQDDLMAAVARRARLQAEQWSGLPVTVYLVTQEEGVVFHGAD